MQGQEFCTYFLSCQRTSTLSLRNSLFPTLYHDSFPIPLQSHQPFSPPRHHHHSMLYLMTEHRSALIHLFIYKPTFRDIQLFTFMFIICSMSSVTDLSVVHCLVPWLSLRMLLLVVQYVTGTVCMCVCTLGQTNLLCNCLLYRYDRIVHYTLDLSQSLT